jgi:DNA (cytosine-5)-methyltransferase 1
MNRSRRILRIGTDCSGIEAPIQALIGMNIPFRHVFASDIDSSCITSIKANYTPEILFGDPEGPYTNGDITSRDISLVPPIDLYVCGFPCQPFSVAGKREGFNDTKGRGNVFWSCLDVIRSRKPKYFLLENVTGLLNHDKGNTWAVINKELSKLKNYTISMSIINTKDYGIPHSRPRLYIVGIKGKHVFTWPSKIDLLRPLSSYVDQTIKKKDKPCKCDLPLIARVPSTSQFIDLSFRKASFPNSGTICPCIIKVGRLWCIPLYRFATIKELLSLQGFPQTFNQAVTNAKLKAQIGNSMSVNVLIFLFESMFSC